MKITIEKIEECIGAEVSGIDISSHISDKDFKQIRDAFYEHSVLVFRDQAITDAEHVTFSERFGPLEMSLASDPFGGGGPIFRISNVDDSGAIVSPEDTRALYQTGNQLWHSDGSFRHVPLKASLMSAKVVPPDGGDTEFASLRAAYASLPEEKRASLDELVVEHSMAHSRAQIAPNLLSKEFQSDVPPVQQLLVRTVPKTGERILLVGSYASHIIGWEIEKGRALLEELLEWSTQRQFVYRHKWRVNDLVMWDNRLCLHRGRPWRMGTHRRTMHRTTLAGDGPTVEQ